MPRIGIRPRSAEGDCPSSIDDLFYGSIGRRYELLEQAGRGIQTSWRAMRNTPVQLVGGFYLFGRRPAIVGVGRRYQDEVMSYLIVNGEDFYCIALVSLVSCVE